MHNTCIFADNHEIMYVRAFVLPSHALLTRYSTSVLKEKYSSSEVVVMGELIKLTFSGLFTVFEMNDSWTASFFRLQYLIRKSHKVVVLAVLYLVGNILAYYALARVEASTYTVFLQLKVRVLY
jgi:hypothetical protein